LIHLNNPPDGKGDNPQRIPKPNKIKDFYSLGQNYK